MKFIQIKSDFIYKIVYTFTFPALKARVHALVDGCKVLFQGLQKKSLVGITTSAHEEPALQP